MSTHETTFEVCGWWVTTIGGFQGEAFCSRPHGHDDDHHDAHGEPIDLPANAERIGHMCAAHDEDGSGTACARRPNHTGPCVNRYGYVFGDTQNAAQAPEPASCTSPRCVLEAEHAGTHADHPEPFIVNGCVSQLGRLLATPGLPRDAAATLDTAASVWTTLDTLLRTGGPLPSRWVARSVGRGRATPVYESLCEALDTSPPGGGYSVLEFPTLRSACRAWGTMDAILCAGGALPEPWEAKR